MAFPIFDKKEQIPEGFRDDYEEREGKWHPKDQTSALSTALAEERDKRKAAEKASAKTLEELNEVKQQQTAAGRGVNSEQLKALRDEVKADLDKEYKAKLEAAATLAAENRKLKLEDGVKRFAAEAGFRPERLDDFWKLHQDEFDLTDDGKPMVKGKPGLEPKNQVAAIAKQRPEWMIGTKAAGGGAAGTSGGSGGGGGAPSVDEQLRNPAALIAAANAAKT